MSDRSHSTPERDNTFIDVVALGHGKMERTNIKIIPSQSAIKKIINFCLKHNLPYADFLKDPHCTIAYSKEVLTPVCMIEKPDFKAVRVTNAYIDTFQTDNDGKVAVIKFESDALQRANAFYRKEYSLTSKYAYSPHITLQKNIPGLLANYPKLDFDFVLNQIIMDNCK